MNHTDHVNLLRPGIVETGGVWADLGAGSGAFTLALADILAPSATIIAVDKDKRALQNLQTSVRSRFPATTLETVAADFTRPLILPPLNGVVMANSLHFHRNRQPILRQIQGYLQPDGRFLLVEYNTDRGNRWVPHPLSFPSWQTLATEVGFAETRLLATRPSSFLGQIYSAVSLKERH